MTDKLKKIIIAAGLSITAFAGGYYVAQPGTVQPKEVITYTWVEKEVIVNLWNKMLEAKKANCEAEIDCEIIDGKPNVIFENINRENIGAKLDEKLGEYEIILEKKVK